MIDGWIGHSVAADVLNPIYFAMRGLKIEFQKMLKRFGSNWTVQTSIGKGVATPDHYIAFLPREQKVSNGIYFCICFDRNGNGCVLGAMMSLTTKQKVDDATVLRATPTSEGTRTTEWEMQSPHRVNVWDRNNAFFTPLEITAEMTRKMPKKSSQMIEEHFLSSQKEILRLIANRRNFLV